MKKVTIEQPENAKEAIDIYTRKGLDLVTQAREERDKYGAALPQTMQTFDTICLLLGRGMIDDKLNTKKSKRKEE